MACRMTTYCWRWRPGLLARSVLPDSVPTGCRRWWLRARHWSLTTASPPQSWLCLSVNVWPTAAPSWIRRWTSASFGWTCSPHGPSGRCTFSGSVAEQLTNQPTYLRLNDHFPRETGYLVPSVFRKRTLEDKWRGFLLARAGFASYTRSTDLIRSSSTTGQMMEGLPSFMRTFRCQYHIKSKTSTAREGYWRLSTHVNPTSTRRAPIRPILGFWRSKVPQNGIFLSRTPTNTMQNLTPIALFSPEQSVTVQTKKKQYTIYPNLACQHVCITNWKVLLDCFFLVKPGLSGRMVNV